VYIFESHEDQPQHLKRHNNFFFGVGTVLSEP
jgi:hypothetical protein